MSGGVILGPDGRPAPRGRLEILVPKGYEDRGPLVGRCLVPNCGQTFYSGEEAAWERHVGECARRNMDEIRALSPRERNKGTVFEIADPEVAAHMKRVGRRMREEGRLEVLPHERAGFS